jgi:hypothetical protein
MRCGGLATRQANTRMLLVTIISVLVFAFLQQLTRLRMAALRRAARERGCPLPSITVADALLDERLRGDRANAG